MAYADARTALRDVFHGATAQATDFAMETMTATEWPPSGAPQGGFPYAYIWSPRRSIEHPPMMRHTQATWRVEVVLGPFSTGIEALSRRMDAWVDALASLADVNLSLGGDVSVVNGWEFSELRESIAYEALWGFDVNITMEIYEAKANAA